MRRIHTVVAGVAVAVGVALVVLGHSPNTSASRTPTTDVPPRRSTTTASIVLPEGTWTFGSGPAGIAVGRMYITGGPKTREGTMPDSPLPGVVEVHRSGETAVLERIAVDSQGKFRIDLPVGDYELVGHSPNVSGEPIDSQSFAIRVGQTTPVDLVVH